MNLPHRMAACHRLIAAGAAFPPVRINNGAHIPWRHSADSARAGTGANTAGLEEFSALRHYRSDQEDGITAVVGSGRNLVPS
jgi:hypothetical protein